MPVMPAATPAPPGGRKPPNRRLRLWLAMGAGILALLCLGGAGVFISLYDEATEIKRTAPDAVADSFLRAYLVNRDEKQTTLYTCASGAELTQLETYRTDILEREKKYSLSIQVTWEGLQVSTAGDRGTVDVDLTRSITDSEQKTDRWRLAVVDDDGWRVCGASKVL